MDFSEPTIEEYKLWAQRAFLQQKEEYINNPRLLTAKVLSVLYVTSFSIHLSMVATSFFRLKLKT